MQTIQTNFEIQETILEQLRQSKINGFPFFAYSGIKNFVMAGETELKLDLPRNPGNYSHIWIKYNYGTDAYDLSFCKNKFNFPSKDYSEIYFDQLAEIIAREMKIL